MSDAKENKLPSGWAITSLGEIIDSAIEQRVPSEGKEFLYVDISSIDNQTKTIISPKLVPTSKSPSRARQHLEPNDVLVSMTRPKLNAVAVLPEDAGHAIGSTGLHVLRAIYVNPKWLFYLVQTDKFISTMSGFVQGVLYPAVRPRDINGFHFFLPPLNEQQRIVAEIEKQLARLHEAIDALTRVERDLRLYRASMLKTACEGGLVPTEAALAHKEQRDYEPASELLKTILKRRRAKWEREQLVKMKAQGKKPTDNRWKERYVEPEEPSTGHLPKLPTGWRWVSVEQISTKVVDGVHKKPNYVDKGIPFITVRNLTAGSSISFERVSHISLKDHNVFALRAKPERGDLLISKDGTLGVVRLVRHNIVFSIFVSVALVKPVVRNAGAYLQIALSSPQVQAQMVPKGSGLQHIHLEDLRADCLPLPPRAEEKRIIAEVEKRSRIVEELETRVSPNLKRAEEFRRSILKRAFAGRLVPQDPKDEPADVLIERVAAERLRRAEVTMKEKKRSPRTKEQDNATGKLTFAEEKKDLLAAFKRKTTRLSIEEAFERNSYSFSANDDEYEDVDAFFEQLSELLTQATLRVEREPGQVFLRRAAR